MNLWLWAENVCVLVSYVNARQTTTTAEEVFNYEVDKMSHLVDVDNEC